jgi:hypothetical protein
MTPLGKALKRSLNIKGSAYVVTLTPDALKLTRKGRRFGMELKWTDLTSGESALAIALRASVGQFVPRQGNSPQTPAQLPNTSSRGRSPSKRAAK